MELLTSAVFLASLLFVLMLLGLEAGRRLGAHRLRNDPEGMKANTSAMDGSIYALLGLLIAFTFSGASTRFDGRRDLILREANSLGTAWMRLDLLPGEAQQKARELLRQYVDARLQEYQDGPETEAGHADHARGQQLQTALWNESVAACRTLTSPAAATLLLPALNDAIDIATMRAAAMRAHPPAIIYVMLFVLGLASALLAGHGLGVARTRNWLHLLAFATATAITVFVILDLEYPRRGLIRIESWDQLIADVRQGMK